MAGEVRLARNIRDLVGKTQMSIYQGIVSGVDGVTCSIRFGSQEVSGIRLRASLSDNDRHMVPNFLAHPTFSWDGKGN